MSKRKPNKPTSTQSQTKLPQHRHGSYSVPINPLPVWCRLEFSQFISSYESYVDKQVLTYKALASYGNNKDINDQLDYWRSVKKSLTYLLWAGTRGHVI